MFVLWLVILCFIGIDPTRSVQGGANSRCHMCSRSLFHHSQYRSIKECTHGLPES
jgi:hypothetical protein